MYPLILFIIAILAAVTHLILSKKRATFQEVTKVLLGYLLPLNVGITAILAFIGHFFYGPKIAALNGWPPDNPYQTEIAMANLALGIVGLLTIWFKKGFWLATALVSTLFFFGIAYAHFVEMASGRFLYLGDLIIPSIILLIAILYTAQNHLFSPKRSS